jgi:SAM-dependent methyltransferase
LAGSLGLLALAGWFVFAGQGVIFAERSFFGVYRVCDWSDEGMRFLFHGSTIHGARSLDEAQAPRPLTYFHPRGPLGRLLEGQAFTAAPRRVLVIGLGVGAIAAYGRRGDEFDFYEIDPVVVAIARNPALFDFLAEARATIDIRVGDGRQLVEGREGASFDLIIADAFSSDAVPVHLLTLEAMRAYLASLKPGGALLFNLTNRHLDLVPVLRANCRELGCCLAVAEDFDVPDEQRARGHFASLWGLVTTEADVRRFWTQGLSELYRFVDEPETLEPWTDDHADILSRLRLFRGEKKVPVHEGRANENTASSG